MTVSNQTAFGIKSNVIQFMAEPTGIVGPDGFIKTGLTLRAKGVTLSVPTEILPWIKPGIAVLVTLGGVQIQPEEPPIQTPQLIIPGA